MSGRGLTFERGRVGVRGEDPHGRTGWGALGHEPGQQRAVAHEVAPAGAVLPRAGLRLLAESRGRKTANALGDCVVRGGRRGDERGEVLGEIGHQKASSLTCLRTCTTWSWWAPVRRAARWRGGSPRTPAVECCCSRPGRCAPSRADARSTAARPGHPLQLGLRRRAAPGPHRQRAARTRAGRVERDQRRQLGARHPRRRRTAGTSPAGRGRTCCRTTSAPSTTSTSPAAPGHGDRGPVPVRRPAGAAAAPGRRAVPRGGRSGWATRRNRTRTQAARPAPGWCRATWSTACASAPRRAYLGRERPNLTVRADAPVARVLLDGDRARGVALLDGTAVEAGEVVLAAGAVATPQLLLLSGIGPADDAARRGCRSRARPAGVGRAGPTIPAVFVPFTNADPPAHPHAPVSQAALDLDAGADPAGDVEVLAFVRPFTPAGELHLMCTLARPDSRGTITLTSPDPRARPRIDYRYLRTEHDRRRLRHAVRTAAELLRAGVGTRSAPGGDVLGQRPRTRRLDRRPPDDGGAPVRERRDRTGGGRGPARARDQRAARGRHVGAADGPTPRDGGHRRGDRREGGGSTARRPTRVVTWGIRSAHGPSVGSQPGLRSRKPASRHRPSGANSSPRRTRSSSGVSQASALAFSGSRSSGSPAARAQPMKSVT